MELCETRVSLYKVLEFVVYKQQLLSLKTTENIINQTMAIKHYKLYAGMHMQTIKSQRGAI